MSGDDEDAAERADSGPTSSHERYVRWVEQFMLASPAYRYMQEVTQDSNPWHCAAVVAQGRVKLLIATQFPVARVHIKNHLVVRRGRDPAPVSATTKTPPPPPPPASSSTDKFSIGFVVSHFESEQATIDFADSVRGAPGREDKLEATLVRATTAAKKLSKKVVHGADQIAQMYG